MAPASSSAVLRAQAARSGACSCDSLRPKSLCWSWPLQRRPRRRGRGCTEPLLRIVQGHASPCMGHERISDACKLPGCNTCLLQRASPTQPLSIGLGGCNFSGQVGPVCPQPLVCAGSYVSWREAEHGSGRAIAWQHAAVRQEPSPCPGTQRLPPGRARPLPCPSLTPEHPPPLSQALHTQHMMLKRVYRICTFAPSMPVMISVLMALAPLTLCSARTCFGLLQRPASFSPHLPNPRGHKE